MPTETFLFDPALLVLAPRVPGVRNPALHAKVFLCFPKVPLLDSRLLRWPQGGFSLLLSRWESEFLQDASKETQMIERGGCWESPLMGSTVRKKLRCLAFFD